MILHWGASLNNSWRTQTDERRKKLRGSPVGGIIKQQMQKGSSTLTGDRHWVFNFQGRLHPPCVSDDLRNRD